MNMTCDYSYLPCQFCVGKNHCGQCGESIREALLKLDGVTAVEMDVNARKIHMELNGVDPDDIADQAEALGVFL